MNRWVAALSVGALLTATACSGGGSPAATDGGGTAEAGAAPADNAAATPAVAKDPFGPLPEKTKMTIFRELTDELLLPEGETATENRYIQVFEEKLNIDYEFPITIKAGPAAVDKMKMLIASNDIPDGMSVGYNMFLQMVKSDMLQDLTQAFEDYASPALKEVLQTDGGKALGLVTVDGKLYGIPSMGTLHDQDPLLWVRKDWLDKLGLPEPETLADMVDIARAFKERDPDGDGQADTIGLPGVEGFVNESSSPFAFDGIFDAHKAYMKLWLKQEDGSYTYGSITPEAKNALSLLRQMYADGLIPKDFAILTADKAVEQIVSGQAGLFFGPWWSGWWPLSDAVKNDPSGDWQAYAIQNVDGEYRAKQMTPIGSIAVLKKGFKYPEALVKTMNAYYAMQLDDPTPLGGDPYAGLQLPSWQSVPIPIPLWRADSVVLDHIGIKAVLEGTEPPKVGKATLDNYKVVADNWKKGVEALKQTPDLYGEPVSRMLGAGEIVEKDIQPVYGDFFGTTSAMEKKKTNLDKLETDAFLKIITGEQPLDYFETFAEEWKRMGGEDILNEIAETMK
ncbi:hypothetical protein [Paenibacillus sp.]|uniref:hypothetical protein n=1 Tax=Paenibacillus sp. TaxID=58172 RepID=UPI002D69A3B0|nr:hypothetical protein [Paenibacillus sp.]HZG57544.1 hypothetical protein [Paenibacillus sp.]